MKAENYIKMEFPSRSANEGFARSATAVFFSQLDPTLEELNDVKTAVSEAVTNCIVHAYPNSIGVIRLAAKLFPEGVLEVTIRDRGVGISDVDKAKMPMFTTGGSERSGMGFTIMESFMDSLKVRSAPDKGTVVTMRRHVKVRRDENK